MSLQECTLEETTTESYERVIVSKKPITITSEISVNAVLHQIWNSKSYKNKKQFFLYASYGTFTILDNRENFRNKCHEGS